MKKLYAILIAAVLMSGTFIQAQASNDDDKTESHETMTASLKGQVVDRNSGEALTGVKIHIPGSDVSAYTDFEGSFKLQGLKPGVYKIKSSYISYEDAVVENLKLEVSDKNQVTIKMKSLEK